jgi:hypothetical protein
MDAAGIAVDASRGGSADSGTAAAGCAYGSACARDFRILRDHQHVQKQLLAQETLVPSFLEKALDLNLRN